jgi:sugar lactone lactonase YvrE
MRVDREDNIWTTDVSAHTVTKTSQAGKVLLVLGSRGQAGGWTVGAASGLLHEPNDIAFGPGGEMFVVQGHGKGEPRVLRFSPTGTLTAAWGERGKAAGQFDIPHSIVVDRAGLVYVADRQNRRVQIFEAGGRFVREWTFAGLQRIRGTDPKTRRRRPGHRGHRTARKGARRVRRGALPDAGSRRRDLRR